MPRITIVIHDLPHRPPHGQAPPTSPVRGTAPGKVARRKRSGKHHLNDSRWLDLAERALSSWPITLRVAVLLVVLLTGTAAVAAILGVGGQLLLAALSLHARRARRRRGSAPRQHATEEQTG